MSKFEKGMVVASKLGGSNMTIGRIDPTGKDPKGSIWCQWFSGSHLHEGFFHPDTLVIIEE